ncbi:Trafficking protein particle complex subunit 8 [Camellia lanceoleosa]|uniref:Trafficking protein particle complex subunit 8 n=1 Tax=Camellia lanceoleosa TaxID=1840588 RepID=A0ACC0IKD7_9ERIC|nr:Trafficking protein particle complex subunit 8 [Camellia lanceoleosa]
MEIGMMGGWWWRKCKKIVNLTCGCKQWSNSSLARWLVSNFRFEVVESKLGSFGQRNATRCGLRWVEMLKTRDQFKEATTVYFRISGEEPLHSAVIFRASILLLLVCKPPMLRKYGFHLVLSVIYIRNVIHAITYRGALTVFKGTKWSHIGIMFISILERIIQPVEDDASSTYRSTQETEVQL